MPVNVTTDGGLSAEVKTFYDRVLLERAVPVAVHAQFGQERPIPKGQGKSIEFRRFSSLSPATTPLTEGTTPAGGTLTATAITATLAQYGSFIEGSDLLDLVAIDPILTETAQLLGEQAGESIDKVVRDVLATGSTVQYANGRASRATVVAGDNLTVTEVRKAVRTLKKNKAKPFPGGDFIGIVGPSAVYDLQSDAAWKDASQYAGSEQIFSGEVGRLYGVRFIETTENKVFTGAGGGGIDVHASLILGANAYGISPLSGQNLEFIFKPLGSSGTADPLNQRWTSSWKSAFVAKILQDLYLIRVEHAVSG